MTYPFTNVCDRLWHTPLLFTLRLAFVVSLNGVNASLFVLSIERLICICRISNYEKSSKPVTVAVILMLITLLLSILFSLLYMQGVEWNEGMVTTSVRNATNAASYQIMLVYYLIVELSSVFLFVFIHYWSLSYRKRIRGFKSMSQRLGTTHIAKYKSLSVKFQIEETLRMTHIFLPIVVVKLVTNVFTNISSMVINAVSCKRYFAVVTNSELQSSLV
ncbi:serpentine type 7TM GPCR receptor class ab chemoreceptor domain-containing protein [Ditylenchus destructor]|uniref:Serpentine type 7TM GPCR receptor class ab chemoreceptor domain-containing protein n=1 Tax=Ditylenchus destructor TaxID=166010 RepID=A0AAD4MPR8_9BILA|nr:serpentine type 7TM GPCR receptor class ab chemoreceptor domain-containing protein [Ditylenchus destructor]